MNNPRLHSRFIVLLVMVWTSEAAVSRARGADIRVVVEEDFSHGASGWEASDPNAWRIEEERGNAIFRLFQQSRYEPPFRSPFNIALLKGVRVGDFVLTARVRSTARDYPHRSMCVIFGHQDPAHFYYVHFGKTTDDHANQIFIVNGAPRTKISTRTSPGTPWDDAWHPIKIVRRLRDGKIEIYFDDMEEPVMIAHDRTFAAGQVGLGSFDDVGDWDDIRLEGELVPDVSTP